MRVRTGQRSMPMSSLQKSRPIDDPYEFESDSTEGLEVSQPPANVRTNRKPFNYSQRRVLNPRRRAFLKLVTLSLLLLVFVTVFFSVSPPNHSTNNDLLFPMAPVGSLLRNYPVSLTAGVIPKRFHSHNDYEQGVPLLKALSYGASSIEADIWLVDGSLLVGHTDKELSPEKTLASLYLDPLLRLLERTNSDIADGNGPRRGVFETAPQLTLQLLIDIKTDGLATFPSLYRALEPLRAAGFLTTASTNLSSLQLSAITVVGTGNTQLESILSLGNSTAPRDVFLDGPLTELSTKRVYNSTVSPLASVNFGEAVGWYWLMPVLGGGRIRSLVDVAHEKGIQARFWNTPIAPIWIRNTVWKMLLDGGADWLNVDDLAAARDF